MNLYAEKFVGHTAPDGVKAFVFSEIKRQGGFLKEDRLVIAYYEPRADNGQYVLCNGGLCGLVFIEEDITDRWQIAVSFKPVSLL